MLGYLVFFFKSDMFVHAQLIYILSSDHCYKGCLILVQPALLEVSHERYTNAVYAGELYNQRDITVSVISSISRMLN